MNNGRRDDILSGHWQEGWSTGWTWDRRCDILRGEGQERWCTDWTSVDMGSICCHMDKRDDVLTGLGQIMW